ncbi:hypothetical protein BD410DRAFT_830323 [Rickenella mellea]|uniref:Uncharacterized protein n=1 Tax=Rickenella mellea TaxID=50990 RepID=A0A4Y7PY48_9AGAM|nr:hypothetical protein BD410DRAFT_830323 [Rickenella mellea]
MSTEKENVQPVADVKLENDVLDVKARFKQQSVGVKSEGDVKGSSHVEDDDELEEDELADDDEDIEIGTAVMLQEPKDDDDDDENDASFVRGSTPPDVGEDEEWTPEPSPSPTIEDQVARGTIDGTFNYYMQQPAPPVAHPDAMHGDDVDMASDGEDDEAVDADVENGSAFMLQEPTDEDGEDDEENDASYMAPSSPEDVGEDEEWTPEPSPTIDDIVEGASYLGMPTHHQAPAPPAAEADSMEH